MGGVRFAQTMETQEGPIVYFVRGRIVRAPRWLIKMKIKVKVDNIISI